MQDPLPHLITLKMCSFPRPSVTTILSRGSGESWYLWYECPGPELCHVCTWRDFISQTDCSHHLWSHISLLESIALSATNHCVCRVFILRQNYRLLICLWGGESRGVLMNFRAEHPDSSSGRKKARSWHVFHQKAESTFCFTFRLNALSPSSFLVITMEGFHMMRGNYISLTNSHSLDFWDV